MKLFIFFLFIPLSFAGSPPSCADLGKYLESFEKDLHQKTISNCKPDLYKTLIVDVPIKDPEFLSERACQELSSIELQLEQAKLEMAVLIGIEKLKLTVGDSKQDSQSTNPAVARVAGKTFVSSLNTAASLETLIATNDENATPFIKKLKEFPENKRVTEKDLTDRISELCKDRSKNEQDACNPKFFQPGKDAALELLNLVNSSNPNPKTIKSWEKMLAIRKKNAPKEEDPTYSFNQMQNELSGAFDRIDQKEVMTKDQLLAIKRLDDFENAPGFSFVEDLAALKDQKKAKIASDQFFLLIGDARVRQQYEAQSKLSVVWNEIENRVPGLSEGERAECSNAKSIFNDLISCLSSLEKELPSLTDQVVKSKLASFLPALRTTVNYALKLNEKEVECRDEIKTKERVTEVCYADFNRDLATTQDKIIQLNLVKDKIGSENMDLMKYRNLALQKWGTQNCQTLSSPMDMCEDADLFSKEAIMTFSESMKIALIFSTSEEEKSNAEAQAQELCDSQERKPNKIHDHLCAFFDDTTSDIIVAKNSPELHPDGPMTAPDGRHAEDKIRDAWIMGGSQILATSLTALMPRPAAVPPPVTYPYSYNYAPYNNNGAAKMGIADSILFNARYHGAYGFYMPTPGYQPGTAFGANVGLSSYNPIGNSGSRYFNSR